MVSVYSVYLLSVLMLWRRSINCKLYNIETRVASNSSGGGFSGDGGRATSAELSRPNAVWIDSVGVLYIVDRGNHRIRFVNTKDIISIFAGSGFPSSSTTKTGVSLIMPATAAALRPFGICGDTLGTVYIVENPTEVVRKVNHISQQISLFAGTGAASTNTTNENGNGRQATSATFYYASYCSVDSSGSVYVSSANEYKVKKVSVSSGIIHTVAGTGVYATTGDGGPATSAALKLPYSLFVESQTLFISLYNGRQVRMVRFDNDTSIITTFAGTGVTGVTGDEGPATSASLSGTLFVGGDWMRSNVFIASSNRVRMETQGTIDTVAGTGEAGYGGDGGPALSARFDGVTQLCVDRNGSVFIPESGNNVVRLLTPVTVPTETPTAQPTEAPFQDQIFDPTSAPAWKPSSSPSAALSAQPVVLPSTAPIEVPSESPNSATSTAPSVAPTTSPTMAAATSISFNSSLVLRNVSSAALDSASQYVVAISVASTLQLKYGSVQCVSQSTLQGPINAINHEILVVVRVTATPSDVIGPWASNNVSLSNSTQLYLFLRDTLLTATSSDVLSTTVRQYSTVYSALDTLFVSNVTSTVSPYFSISGSENESESTETNTHATWMRVTPTLSIVLMCVIVAYMSYRVLDYYFLKDWRNASRQAHNAQMAAEIAMRRRSVMEVTVLGVGELDQEEYTV